MASKKLDTKTSEEKAHATYSASGAERWLNCPGSIALCEKAPEAVESVYAAEGTTAHACFELLLKNMHQLEKAKRLAERQAEFSDEMVEHAAHAVEWIEHRLFEMREDPFRASDEEIIVMCEQKVDSSHFTCTGQFGTLDASLVDVGTRLVVADYKYGAGIAVDPDGENGKGNPQLVYYALGVAKQFDFKFDEVELVVIQPRAPHMSGETIRSFTMTMEELRAWEPIFRNGVMESSDPNAPLKAGKWCKFCKAAPICDEIKNTASRQAQLVFAETPGDMELPNPVNNKIKDLGKILEGCEKLSAWIERVEKHALWVLQSGGKIDGWKLVEKRTPRQWHDPDAVAADAELELGEEAFVPAKLHSPAQIEKRLRDVPGIKAWVEERVVTKASGTTMVKESDRRPAVVPLDQIFGKEPPALPTGKKKGRPKK